MTVLDVKVVVGERVKQVSKTSVDDARVDFHAKSGHRVKFHGGPKCPDCQATGHTTLLFLTWILSDQWPYSHTDFNLTCPRCGWSGTFGMASSPIFGMELIIWDHHPKEVLDQVTKITSPPCPFHGKPMVLTKIWGDKVMDPPTVLQVQWKCPETFLTAHAKITRLSPYTETDEIEKKRVYERLKALGYAS